MLCSSPFSDLTPTVVIWIFPIVQVLKPLFLRPS